MGLLCACFGLKPQQQARQEAKERLAKKWTVQGRLSNAARLVLANYSFKPSSPAEASEYVLHRRRKDSSRLNLDFFLWKSLLQFNLHPEIAQLEPDARIADVATGTGLWLVDLASELPATSRLDGFTSNLVQAPAAAFLPENVQLHRWDMSQDLPTEFVGQFDVVHIRLVAEHIKNNDPVPLIRNLRKLLKPGGYLQWEERNTTDAYIRTVDPAMQTPALQNLLETVKYLKSTDQDNWKALMPDTLDQHGFTESKLHSYECSLAMARFWNDMYVEAWEELPVRLIGNVEQADKIISAATAEVHMGAAVVYPVLVWVARAV